MHVTYLVKLAGVQGSFWVQEIQPCTNVHVPPSLFFCSFLPFTLLQAIFLSFVYSPKIITGLNHAFYLHFFESLHFLALEALHTALVLVSLSGSDPEGTDAPP